MPWSLPVGLTLVIFHEWLLRLFGPGFDAAGTATVVIVGAYLVSALAATSGVSLLMTGNVSLVVLQKVISLLANFSLCLALVPALGTVGAAIGFAADVVLGSLIRTVMVWRRLGVNCTIFTKFPTA